MGWFSKKKKEPEAKAEVVKAPAEPTQEFGVWIEDGRYRIQFSGGGELIVSRRMYSFMDHFAGKFMSLGSYNNETLMKQIWQLLEQHGLGFPEDYEEPDDDDGDDEEPEVDPDSEPDLEEEVEEEVVDEPDPSVATVEAPSEAPAAVEGAPRNGRPQPSREALPLRSR